jgi:hypothetical protein
MNEIHAERMLGLLIEKNWPKREKKLVSFFRVVPCMIQ